jgi:hypothetical protein
LVGDDETQTEGGDDRPGATAEQQVEEIVSHDESIPSLALGSDDS